jgi:GTP-binding protein
VQNEVFDLFAALDATDEQLDFPTLFAVGRDGWAAPDPSGPKDSLRPLLDLIVSHVPPPTADPNKPFSMLATILEADPYLGRVITGRIHTGRLKPNMVIKVLDRQGTMVDQARLTKVLAYRGLERAPLETAEAGDIVAVAGLERATVSQTLCDPEVTSPIPADPIDPPTLSVTFWVNDSPLAGRDGNKITSRMLRARLFGEAEGNVAISVRETERTDGFEVAGRGELQLGVLIETMRREGFELAISRPRVLFKTDEAGHRLEPIEECVVDVDEEYAGVVVDKLSQRKGELADMRPMGGGKQRITIHAPTRGLIGYHGEFLTDTRGTGVMHRIYHGYARYKGEIGRRRNGVLISTETGRAVPYALWNLEERGAIFIDPGTDVYRGMVVGEHSRGNDLDVNPLREKQLTNIRTTAKDEAVRLTPPRKPTLEQAIAYIEDDELVEVTPRAIRIRKRLLEPHQRKRASRAAE